MKVHVPAEIWDEAVTAAQFYEAASDGLGAELLEQILGTLERIEENPLQFPVIEKDIRRGLTKRFPVGVFFSIEQDAALVIAILDLRRSPSRWKRRRKKR